MKDITRGTDVIKIKVGRHWHSIDITTFLELSPRHLSGRCGWFAFLEQISSPAHRAFVWLDPQEKLRAQAHVMLCLSRVCVPEMQMRLARSRIADRVRTLFRHRSQTGCKPTLDCVVLFQRHPKVIPRDC